MKPTPHDQRPNKCFYTVHELSERWQCSERTLRRLIGSGALPVHRFGNLVRISEADLRIYERMNRED